METKKTSSFHGFGTDALVELEVEDRPFCEHGPTLLFQRFFKDGGSKQFFACAACRDRKDCAFFQWKDDKITDGKKLIQKEIKKTILKQKRSKTLQNEDFWCSTCQAAVGAKKIDSHSSHTLHTLTSSNLLSPTAFLNPLENNKFNAQYFFDIETCQFLMTTIQRLHYKKIVCIGCPSLFESISVCKDENISAFLLDIDQRFEFFYGADNFQRYNMFNHFFFHRDGCAQLIEFIKSCKAHEILVVVDPPFGGLVNVLRKTFQSIWNLAGDVMLATILVFPYFLQAQVEENLPNFQMLDFKVSYNNHPKYTNSASAHGSPVRIFTNIPADRVQLPQDGYKFCKLCQRYVYKENWHCKICKYCTSKDGRTYVHCDQCKVCVKPGRVHCKECDKCQPQKHVCLTTTNIGCHICGDVGHKRKGCPKKQDVMKTERKKRAAKTVKSQHDNKKKRILR